MDMHAHVLPHPVVWITPLNPTAITLPSNSSQDGATAELHSVCHRISRCIAGAVAAHESRGLRNPVLSPCASSRQCVKEFSDRLAKLDVASTSIENEGPYNESSNWSPSGSTKYAFAMTGLVSCHYDCARPLGTAVPNE
eukprot:4899762-Amphidinium_carterae.1